MSLTDRYIMPSTLHPILLHGRIAWVEILTSTSTGIFRSVTVSSISLRPAPTKSLSSTSPLPPLPSPDPFPSYPTLLTHLTSPLTNGTITALEGYPRSGRTTVLKNLARELKVELHTPETIIGGEQSEGDIVIVGEEI